MDEREQNKIGGPTYVVLVLAYSASLTNTDEQRSKEKINDFKENMPGKINRQNAPRNRFSTEGFALLVDNWLIPNEKWVVSLITDVRLMYLTSELNKARFESLLTTYPYAKDEVLTSPDDCTETVVPLIINRLLQGRHMLCTGIIVHCISSCLILFSAHESVTVFKQLRPYGLGSTPTIALCSLAIHLWKCWPW